MKPWITIFFLILSLVALSGCGPAEEAVSAAAQPEPAQTGADFGGDAFQSAYLNQDYEGAMPVTTQLSLGTLQLEGTDKAVTPDQAAKLVIFWQALGSGSIQNATERNAILKQIESTMTAEQMETIKGMALTFQDMGQWAESNGIELPQGRVGGRGGPGGAFANLTDEQRAELRQMTPEERQARLRELGIEIPEGGFGGGQGGGGEQGGPRRGGQFSIMTESLIELLEARAAE